MRASTRRLRFFDPLVPTYLAVAVLALWVGGAPWLGEWQWTFDDINGITVLLGPFTAGAAAWRTTEASLNHDVFSSTVRGWAVPLRCGATVIAGAGGAWFFAAVSGVVGTSLVTHGGPAPVWILIAGPLVLVASTAFGVAVGHRWPGRVVAIMVAPVLFLIGGLASALGLPGVLRQGPGTATLAGLRWDPAEFALEMAALALVAVTLAVVSARIRGATSRRTVLVPIALAALTVILLVTIARSPGPRFVRSREQPTRCVSSRPAICVAPSNARALAALVRQFARVTPAARALGLALPGSFREVLPNHLGGEPWGIIDLGADANSTHPPIAEVLDAVATPGDCRAYYDPTKPPSDAVYEAQRRLVALLRQRMDRVDTPIRHADAAWARTTYRRLRQCRLAAITVAGSARHP